MLARFDITPTQIETVVAAFYAAVRRDPALGPVFARHVGDWPAHEAKIARFWARAILGQPGYDGNPMQAHLAAGNVAAEHFPIWLSLFDETLRRNLPPDAAGAWSALAHRIGRGLRMGIEDITRTRDGPPVLSQPRIRGGRPL